jgi:hypothetical protein
MRDPLHQMGVLFSLFPERKIDDPMIGSNLLESTSSPAFFHLDMLK